MPKSMPSTNYIQGPFDRDGRQNEYLHCVVVHCRFFLTKPDEDFWPHLFVFASNEDRWRQQQSSIQIIPKPGNFT